MRIKSLEISGFKSFAQRARLRFGPGITGVVGPNGCGKSNIVDAIRWVMGEASAKHLRGRAMQDVIFAGAEGRNPQSMAEVTLVFDNDGDVPEPYLSASEVAVTRRLFRDGTSEYLLNKAPVRLRDVTDLFLGTGVGTRAYSIIEQGRISFVVSARPEERRQLIEEVAGITKFKVRKKAAERRMEATEQNLARVRDVVQELQRQLGTLTEQARRARLYKERKAELFALELCRASHEWLRLRLLGQAEQAAAHTAEEALNAEEARLTGIEADAQSREQALCEQEAASAAMHDEVALKEAALAAGERDLAHWQQRATELSKQAEQGERELAALQHRAQQADEELQRLQKSGREAAETQQQAQTRLQDALAHSQAASAALADKDAELGRLRHEALAQVQAAAMVRGRIQSWTAKLEGAEQAMAALHEQQQSLQADHAAAAQRRQERSERFLQCEQQAAACEEEKRLEAANKERLEQERQRAAQALREQEQALGREQSRLQSLTEIVRRLDGYSDGTRFLLGRHKNGEPRFAGLLGVVAEVLEVPKAHERAIEAALGERLQHVRFEGRAQAQAALSALQEQKSGQAGLVPMDAASVAVLPKAVVAPRPGVLGEAKALVRARPGAEALVDSVLGGIVLVTDRDAAEREAAAHRGLACLWVTEAGEWIDGRGALGGGAASGAGLLRTRREIRQLTESSQALAEAVQQAQIYAQNASEALEASRAAHAAAHSRLHGLQLEQGVARRDLEALDREQARLTQRLAAAQSEGERLAQSRAQAQKRLQEALDEASEADGRSDQGREAMAALEAERTALLAEERRKSQALTEAKVAQAAQAERQAAAAQAIERLQAERERFTQAQKRAQRELEQAKQDALGLRAQGEQGADAQKAQQQQAHALRQTLAENSERLGELREAQRAVSAALGEGRRQVAHLQAAHSAHRMAAEKIAREQEHWVTLARERHEVCLYDELPAFADKPAPSAQDKRDEARLAKEIKQMGAISLTAIDECEAVQTRERFLRQQQEDLEEALQSLRQAVLRINRNSRERFVEAFDAVNDMFQKVYPRLFHGGSAKLLLTQSDDVLEAGVDIVAMPPGKKLQNVTLLSGGEKALTATALVFSIFLIKPSPFCILDEVDAPLDEANVGRFNDMLREMRELSQFIVITHNKQTMLQMDRLYGITMEDAGMSKVVAVDLQKRGGEQAA